MSCLTLTPAPTMIRTGTKTPEVVDYAFEGNMKNGPISELLVTKTGHRPTQFKKITDTLPVLCTDKNFQSLNEVLWIGINLGEIDFMPPYPNTTQWSSTHHVKIQTVTPGATEHPRS